MELLLIILCFIIWVGTHYFFGNGKKTAGITRIAIFILQALTIWSFFSVGLILINIYSDQSVNLGFLFFPLLVVATITTVMGPFITFFINSRNNKLNN